MCSFNPLLCSSMTQSLNDTLSVVSVLLSRAKAQIKPLEGISRSSLHKAAEPQCQRKVHKQYCTLILKFFVVLATLLLASDLPPDVSFVL